jgi:flagellar FliJ protein
MKKFRFRLERVLQYRQTIKREKHRDLIKEQIQLQEHLNLLVGLEQELQSVGVEDGAVILARDVKMLGDYAGRLRSNISDTQREIEEAQKRVERAREIYQEAAKEAEALEKLKARKNSEFQAYVLKEEEKFLDELAVMRFEVKPKEGA